MRLSPPLVPTSERFRAAMAAMAVPGDDWPPGLEALLARHYGWTGKIQPLSSEVEQTARLAASGAPPLILKVSSRPEAVSSFRFQTGVLAGLEGASGFDAPRLQRTRSGQQWFEDDGICGYVQSAVGGVQLASLTLEPGQRHAAGQALGALDQALAGLDVPGQDRPVLWNIDCWPGLLTFLPHIRLNSTAALVRDAMERFLEQAQPLLPELPWQVTHNDPSPHNMFLAGHRFAFIDFGDGGRAPRLQDLAIAMSHLALDAASPLGGTEPLIAGYGSVLPLSPLEARLLIDLTRARQAALILINAWRAELFPAEAAYINKNVARAERGLALLGRLDRNAAEAAVWAAAGHGTRPSLSALAIPKEDSDVH